MCDSLLLDAQVLVAQWYTDHIAEVHDLVRVARKADANGDGTLDVLGEAS